MASSAITPPSNAFEDVFSETNKARAIAAIEKRSAGIAGLPQYLVSKILTKKAAVLIPLCVNMKGEPCLLFTLRSLKLSKHRGEICFPGGVSDPEDADSIATALRETEEELNIPKDRIEIWSTLMTMPTASSLMGVVPVLGLIKEPLDPDALVVNRDEVEKAFTISLEHLCDKANWGHTQFHKGLGMPIYKNMKVYHPPGEYTKPDALSSSEDEESGNQPIIQDVRLWGLTAILTHIVLEALLPGVYNRKIHKASSSPKDKGPPSKTQH